MSNAYKEYRDRLQAEFNKLPIFFALTDEQFDREMRQRGLTGADTDQVYRVDGVFYLRKDAEQVRAWLNKDHLAELREKMKKDAEFAAEAFYYEMENHEYPINTYQGDWDVCSCFGDAEWDEEKTGADYLRELGFDDETIAVYNRAKKKLTQKWLENDWA